MAEIVIKFGKAFEKGLKGEVESFKVWLEKQRIDSAKFEYGKITDELLANHFFINRSDELETVAEFLGFYIRDKKEIFHIPIIGAIGLGKTTLLRTIEFALSKLDTPVKFKYYNAEEFSEQDEKEEQQRFFRYLEEARSEKYDVLLVDSCERDKSIDYSLKSLARVIKKFVLITSWEPQFWFINKDRIEEVVPTSKELSLKPFSKEEIEQLIDKVLWIVSNGQTKVSKEVVAKISEFSDGIPRVAIQLFIKSFNESFLAEKSGIDPECVVNAAKALGILGLKEKLEKLTDMHETILRLILQSTDTRGIRPTELVEKLNKDKATVSYHLNYLFSENLLYVRRIGRYAFYQVREELKPFIQLKIMHEGDFLA